MTRTRPLASNLVIQFSENSLNEKQIKAYKLGRYLDKTRDWWEHIDSSSRA